MGFIIFISIAAFVLIFLFMMYGPTAVTTQQKFAALGNMSNMTKKEVIAKVGQPNSITNLSHGQLVQWISPGYHISILFDNQGKFIKIQHEYKSK